MKKIPSNLTEDTFEKFNTEKFLKEMNNILLQSISKKNIFINDTFIVPAEQKININTLKINNRENSFLINSLPSILKTLDLADNAFLNSILATSIYSDNIWTLQNIDKNLTDMTVKIEEAMNNREDLYKLKIWHFNKNVFKKVSNKSLKLAYQSQFHTSYGQLINYFFKDGHYTAFNGLSYATVHESEHTSGKGKVLHLTYRGTEFSRLPEYIVRAYSDMEAYFETFKPLNEAIQKYINNPENNIKEVQVSGHSLGGAMVQKFLQLTPKEETLPEVNEYTFGSPGSKKHFFVKFFNMGYHLLVNHSLLWEAYDKNDERLHEFYHSNDPIPKIGLLGYQRTGIIHHLFDQVYEHSKEANLETSNIFKKLPALGNLIGFFKEKILSKFQVRFHNSKRYTINICSLIEQHYKAYPQLQNNFNERTLYWQQYFHNEKNFRELSMKYQNAFIDVYKKTFPKLDDQSITKKILKMRQEVFFDYEAESILSKKLKQELKTFKDNNLKN